ncbi:MAG TPA: putative baseplate assembly protein [Pyrinomonadaceae bacterium]|jgi:hypothetical protein
MPLKTPNLDDRQFSQMVEESLRRVRETCPQWTDLSPNDPGVVLVELFAFLTEAMIYRLNRLPEKAYVEFLRLIGVKLTPPTAAVVKLNFSLKKAPNQSLSIPGGTRVTLSRAAGGGTSGEPPVFTTLQTVVIPKGELEAEVLAYNCELIEAEPVGKGTGMPGLSVTVKRPPIVARTSDDLEMLVGVEASAEELRDRPRAKEHSGKNYRIWTEVENFSNLDDKYVYMVDRVTGAITFAPAVQLRGEDGNLAIGSGALGEKPPEGREILVWYASGGGAQGNVAPNTLTVLKTPIAGVAVTNPAAATGGRDTESLQNTLLRGPQELHSLHRAVTADDFELLALRSSGAVTRAKAFTKAMLWQHAAPGTIEVLLVPSVPEQQRAGGVVTLETLQAQETDEARQLIRRALDERRPLGTVCLVNWVHYKKVGVSAQAVIHRGADAESVRSRVLKRLHQTINPLPSADVDSGGWTFGEPLRASHIYDILLAERDVSYVENVRLHLDEVPENDITSIAVDYFQPQTWYSATGSKLFRTMDDGEGWELINVFADEQIELIRTNKIKAGMLATVTRLKDKGSRLYVTADSGETWRRLAQTDFTINDLTWTWRDGSPLLILATDDGLYELSLQLGASPVQILVDPQKPKLGFYAVTSSMGIRGTFYIAVAARNLGGIYLSARTGTSETFTNIGLQGDDVRVLEIQQDGVRTFLWAGVAVAGNEAGKGCFRWELQGSTVPNAVVKFQKGWEGGSCLGLAFKDSLVFAGTFQKGVLWLDTSKGETASWHAPLLESGLPIRDAERSFYPVEALAALSGQKFVLAGGRRGVYRSDDNGTTYESVSQKVFDDKVTLPETWLFCSGTHEIEIIAEK